MLCLLVVVALFFMRADGVWRPHPLRCCSSSEEPSPPLVSARFLLCNQCICRKYSNIIMYLHTEWVSLSSQGLSLGERERLPSVPSTLEAELGVVKMSAAPGWAPLPPINSTGLLHFHPLIRYIYFSGISLTRIDCAIIAYFFGPLAVNLEEQRAEAGRPSLSGLTPAAPRAAMTTATDVSHAARAPRVGEIDLAAVAPRAATDLPSVPGSIICFI